MKQLFWRLTSTGAVPCTPEEWERRNSTDPSRRIAHDVVDGVTISTIFSGINSQEEPNGPPLIYHTTIFGKAPRLEYAYATREEAIAGHRRWVEHHQDQTPPDDDIGNKL